jgi:uncharacterized membrane protein
MAFLRFLLNAPIMLRINREMQTQLVTARFNGFLRLAAPIAAAIAVAIWLYVAPPGLLGKLDALGYAICHRIDARSFQLGERQLPLCARCTGEFFTAGVALLFQAGFGPRR